MVHTWLVCTHFLCNNTNFSPFGGVGVINVLEAFMIVFNSSLLGHIWVACLNSSHNVQGYMSLKELEVSPFLLFFFSFLVAPIVVSVGRFRVGEVLWSGGTEKLPSFMCLDSLKMVMGIRYQTGIVRVIFGNVRVSMAWCEPNPGGGHKNGIWIIVGGKFLTSSVGGGSVSGTDSLAWAMFDEIIIHTGALVFGTSSCLTGGSPRNVPRRFDGLN